MSGFFVFKLYLFFMIRFKNVSLELGNKQLLKDFNLKVHRGEKIVFSAPSGSGKSTLLKLILGFIDPDDGKIIVKEKEVKPGNLKSIRSHIGYLSQGIDLPNGKVRDVFQEIFSYSANKSVQFSDNKLIEKLKELSLEKNILQKNTSEISGGERQRLGWALVMLLDRGILLLDEPTSALDEKTKKFFINYTLNSKKTVICVSHDPEWRVSGAKVISSLI